MSKSLLNLSLYSLLLVPATALSQIMNNLETKHLSDILAIEHQLFSLDYDTVLTEKRVEYYDGSGNMLYAFEDEETRHWIKQHDVPYTFFNIYNNGNKDSHLAEKQLNDSTYRSEYFIYDSLCTTTYVFLDPYTFLRLPDSSIMNIQLDEQQNFVRTTNTNKEGEVVASCDFEVLAIDEKGNWLERVEKNQFGEFSYTELRKRTIKYTDEYEISKFYELSVDTASLNGQIITDPESLNPDPNDSAVINGLDDPIWDQMRVHRFFKSFFFQHFLSDDYYLRFALDSEMIADALEERLLYQCEGFAFDIKNGKYYAGRTRTGRWFDGTNKIKLLEQIGSTPTPTEQWVEINGYHCREYVKPGLDGKSTDRFFVTKDLPFVNYAEFDTALPGFVMKCERHFPEIGEIKLVMNINEVRYPFHLLEFVDKLKEELKIETLYLRRRKN